MPEQEVTEEFTTLIRGFFTLPVLSAFGRSGILDVLLDKPEFNLNDFQNIPNKKLLKYNR